MLELNVTRDLLRFRYRLRSEIEKERIVYDLYLKEWSQTGMVLQVNFTEPRVVSNVEYFDLCEIEVIDPKLFISKETGITLGENDRVLHDQFPR